MDYSEKISQKQTKIMNSVLRKYGYDKIPSTIFFERYDEDLIENIAKFKAMFQIEDSNLKTYLWNSIYTYSGGLADVDESDFSSEEYEFIKARFKALELRYKLDVDNRPNLNGEIKSERLILRRPSKADEKTYRRFLKEDGDFERYTGMKMNRNNLDMLSTYASPYMFSVVEKKSGKMVGLVGLYGYDYIRKMANIQWYIFKSFRSRGYAREAITALANQAFLGKLFEMYEDVRQDVLKKHYAKVEIIRAVIRVSNVSSQKTAVACGFKEQYTDRRHAIIFDKYYEDCIVYDLEQ